jgi:hypothetical protein
MIHSRLAFSNLVTYIMVSLGLGWWCAFDQRSLKKGRKRRWLARIPMSHRRLAVAHRRFSLGRCLTSHARLSECFESGTRCCTDCRSHTADYRMLPTTARKMSQESEGAERESPPTANTALVPSVLAFCAQVCDLTSISEPPHEIVDFALAGNGILPAGAFAF